MRIASFNVENMFRRPRALNPATYNENKPILEAYSRLQTILEKPKYSDADKRKILELLEPLGLSKKDDSEWAVLRRSRGRLVTRPKSGAAEVVPKGRGDWIGWLELKREAVDEEATRNTARVIAGLNADVLAVIEAEDRPALDRFNRDVLALRAKNSPGEWPYRHVMLIDGNDDRGIDVGLLTRDEFPIVEMRSHVDDLEASGDPIFSRDCAEYQLRCPGGQQLLVMANHFKSKGYGKAKDSNATRREQAARVAEIYNERRKEGIEHVAVVGDLNDTPDSRPLAPVLQETDLRDVSAHDAFKADARTGTYGTGNDKIDYVLLSPALFEKVQGWRRRTLWGLAGSEGQEPLADARHHQDSRASSLRPRRHLGRHRSLAVARDT